MEEWSLEEKEDGNSIGESKVILGERTKLPYILSVVLLALVAVSSAGGLFLDEIYQETTIMEEVWMGFDLIGLFVFVPLLGTSLTLSVKNHERAKLLLIGTTFFVLINFIGRLFSTQYNIFFPIYVGTVVLSGLILIFLLRNPDIKKIGYHFGQSAPIKSTAGYMGAVCGILIALHALIYILFWINGELPQFFIDNDFFIRLVSTIDLIFIVPVGLTGAIWLWKGKSWGYVYSIGWNLGVTIHYGALSSASLMAFQTGTPENIYELAIWIPIAVASLIITVIMLDRMKTFNR